MSLPVPIEVYLICFGAGSAIHAAQVILQARFLRQRPETHGAGGDSLVIVLGSFFWQFGNFFELLAVDLGYAKTSIAYQLGDLMRNGSLVCFPLIFSYMSLIPPSSHFLSRIGRYLRYPLWPWTILSLVVTFAAAAGVAVPASWTGLVFLVTLHMMLVYFVIFTITTAQFQAPPEAATVSWVIRARKATVIAGILSIATFVLMLTGYWRFRVPFFGYIELAAMMMSVPFAVAVAYRLYELPFMDAFIREVISGALILGGFSALLAVSKYSVWVAACAIAAVYCKAPLTRWVERTFIGYAEPVEEQEERIGSAIRALTRMDEFKARVSEILAAELESEWAEISPVPRADAVHRFEITGSGLWLSVGLRTGGRRYMSRQLRIARTAALQLSAHHHQLNQQELRDATARAQMRALQAQINPHFLFNTLNVLASLIHSNPTKAERVTEELADIFRYALESTRVEWVKLDDELRFIEACLAIEKTRFEDRLTYSLDVDTRLRSMRIPPMILQPLVENAIKHGIGPKVEGGEVRIAARLASDRLEIVVEDTGAGRSSKSRQRGAGIGLSNIQERLLRLFGDAGALRLEERSPEGMRAVLTLPQMKVAAS